MTVYSFWNKEKKTPIVSHWMGSRKGSNEIHSIATHKQLLN